MGSDHRPLAYEASALPLSYATETWQTVMDSNQRMSGSKPGALPLGERPKKLGGRYRTRTCGPIKRPRFSKPLHYHSGNLPDMSGYEFRRRSIFAVGFHAALTTSAALLYLDAEAGFEPAISGL